MFHVETGNLICLLEVSKGTAITPGARPRDHATGPLIALAMVESRTAVDQSRRAWLAKGLAGTGAGVVSTVLCSPLDVAKTRIQVQTAKAGVLKYSGIYSSLRTIYMEEGVAGWYQGFTPAVCSVAVFWTVYFPCYDYSKVVISDALSLPTSSPLVHMTAAAASGLVTDVITNPFWVVRTRLATQYMRHEQISQQQQTVAPIDGSSTGVRSGGAAAASGSSSVSSCLLYTSPSPRDGLLSRMPSSA